MTSSHSPHTAPANRHLPSTCRFLSQDFCNVFRPRPCFHTLDMNTLLIHDALIISCEFLCKRYENTSSLNHPYRRLFLQAQPQSESDTGNSPARRMPWSDSTGQPGRGACRGTHPARAAFTPFWPLGSTLTEIKHHYSSSLGSILGASNRKETKLWLTSSARGFMERKWEHTGDERKKMEDSLQGYIMQNGEYSQYFVI